MQRLSADAMLLAMVDGIGGGPAATAAAETMREALTEYPVAASDPERALSELVVAASEAILGSVPDSPALDGFSRLETASKV